IPSNSPGLLVLEKPWVKPGSRTTPKGLRQKIAPLFGTICHFDFKPGRIDDLDVELLEYMASLAQSQL
ncbi:MAG: hypothetical protein SGI71_05650, partial [Verrucomicrobiota bacterium]|nr:hypothetical protein [Verrucomicrobiota bacterium]